LVIAIGIEYKSETWRDQWPVAMRNLVQASLKHDFRVVFVDNLYMYGPQKETLHEGMSLTAYPGKPAVRAEVTRIWENAAKEKGLKFTALRASDFFGPNVLLSQLGEAVFGNLSKGGTAQFLLPIDQPHDFAYVPDIARAVHTLLNAPDSDFGQIWHLPCAPTMTTRSLMALGAESLGVAPKTFSFPLWFLRILGLFLPLAKELWEMRFQWNRPYIVNADKFKQRFAFKATPFSESIPTTARSFNTSNPS
jgi:nucleoside-diphosphate-sugar epimerase